MMKIFLFCVLSSILVIFVDAISGFNIRLSALRPDLEYLRGYWLQNPNQINREGRVVFSNKSQIVVDFEKSTNPIQDEAWTKDFLRLKGIHEMPKCNLAAAIDELYYKHGTFYIRRNPYALPETLPEHDNNWISTLPTSSEDDGRSVIRVQYVYLNTLASKIDSKVEQIDLTTTESLPVPLKSGENRFRFDFVKGRMQLFIRHVRLVEFVPLEYSNTDVNYIRSEEIPFIRYDRHKKRFYSAGDTQLDGQGFIRSSVGSYVLRDVLPDVGKPDLPENPDAVKKGTRPKNRTPTPEPDLATRYEESW